MELKDLCGEHVLTGVDFDTIPPNPDEYYDEANSMTFILDGKAYCAIEDPSDGYRSSLRDLFVATVESVKNTFEPCRVVGTHKTTRDYGGSCDILELIDVTTGQVVLEVGTDNDDDYYPWYVAYFRPQNMAANQPQAPAVASGVTD